MIPRAICEAAFFEAVRGCNPTRLVHDALARRALSRPLIGLAVGKAALAMARGLPDVDRGLCITNVADGEPLPLRWQILIAAHPFPDETSHAAGLAALALVESVRENDTLVALISGGTSSLIEVPLPGITLDDIRTRTREAMARGATIQELNALRSSLSAIKGGKLAHRSLASVVTLALSDVPGDDPRVIGSGPTVADRNGDDTDVIAPLSLFGDKLHAAFASHGITIAKQAAPITSDVGAVGVSLARDAFEAPLLAWGEPTVTLPPDHGVGGRATQLALTLAFHLRNSTLSAFVAASDGRDGPTDAAGAFVDGTTWSAIAAAGLDPHAELKRCNATPALASVGSLFCPGATGINHADVVVIG
jgi:hydroxypyruvate reductase